MRLPRQHDARDVGTFLELLAQQGGRTVFAAVVDEDDFVARTELVECRIQPREEQRQRRFFVVDGNDDGNERRGHDCSRKIMHIVTDRSMRRRIFAHSGTVCAALTIARRATPRR